MVAVGPSPHSSLAALAWADRLYAKAAPLPQEEPEFAIQRSVEAYRQVERRYGPLIRARIGTGDCLMLMGRYDEAMRAYPPGSRLRDARYRASLARRLGSWAKGRGIVQIEPVQRADGEWIVLFAYRGLRQDYGGVPHTAVGIREFEERETMIRPIGAEVRLYSKAEEPARLATLYTVHLGQTPTAIVVGGFAAANCAPTEQIFLRIDSQGLHRIKTFRSVGDMRLFTATNAHGFRILITPTYKIWWSDVYEWKARRFQFANRTSPRLLEANIGADYSEGYGNRLKHAALHCINRRWRRALDSLLRAEHSCEMAAREYKRGDDGWWGNPVETLAEIRQRIRWLQKRDYDHALLYRPYDWDLQVPPYKLDHAGDKR